MRYLHSFLDTDIGGCHGESVQLGCHNEEEGEGRVRAGSKRKEESTAQWLNKTYWREGRFKAGVESKVQSMDLAR